MRSWGAGEGIVPLPTLLRSIVDLGMSGRFNLLPLKIVDAINSLIKIRRDAVYSA